MEHTDRPPRFWKRNSDEILKQIVSSIPGAIVVAIVGAMITYFFIKIKHGEFYVSTLSRAIKE
jgi:hypothetical protein